MSERASHVTIRPCSLEEFEEMDVSWMEFILSDTDGDLLIVEGRAGKVLAYCQHAPHETRPEDWHVLNRLETRPHYRRRAYARALVERVLAESGARLVIARGVQSPGFWRRLGFEPDGYGAEREAGVQYSHGTWIWRRRDTPPAATEEEGA